MSFNVAEFRANMVGDGARPNLFEVTLIFPPFVDNGSLAGQKVSFMGKAAQLPGSSIGTAPLFYFGRELKFAGNRTFPQWSLTVINDEDFTIRGGIESWMNSINNHVQNLRDDVAYSPTDYSTDAIVTQFGKDGTILKEYKFVGMFPIDLAPIDLDWGSNDSIEEYGITFDYQWWENNLTN